MDIAFKYSNDRIAQILSKIGEASMTRRDMYGHIAIYLEMLSKEEKQLVESLANRKTALEVTVKSWKPFTSTIRLVEDMKGLAQTILYMEAIALDDETPDYLSWKKMNYTQENLRPGGWRWI